MSKNRHEYAFDVKLFAVVRIITDNPSKARNLIRRALCAATIDWHDPDGKLCISETSLSEDGGPILLEIDGEGTEEA